MGAAAPTSVIGPAFVVGASLRRRHAAWGLRGAIQGANERIRLLLAVMLVLYLAGLGMVSIAPLYS